MPRPTKRKAAHKQVSRDKRGKFIKEDELNLIDTESSTFELMETGLSDDSPSEKLWENDEVKVIGEVMLIRRQNKIFGTDFQRIAFG